MLPRLRHLPKDQWGGMIAASLIAHVAAHGFVESWGSRTAPWFTNAPQPNVAPASSHPQRVIDGPSTADQTPPKIARGRNLLARGARHGAHETAVFGVENAVGCRDSLATRPSQGRRVQSFKPASAAL